MYLIIINVLTLAVYGLDKWKAVHGRWRISEKELIGLAVIGGSAGALLGMHLFRHKTRKPLFAIGVPAVLMVQVLAAVMLRWQFCLI